MKKYICCALLITTISFTSCAKTISNSVPPVPPVPPVPMVPVEDKTYTYDWPNTISKQNDNFSADSFSFDLPIDTDTIKKIKLDVETQSGAIAISIKDSGGNELFKQSDMATSSTEINVTASDIYNMEIIASSHTGSFTVTPVE